MLATAILVAQYAGTFDALDTTRVQARASQPAPIVSIGGATSNANAPSQGRDVISADVATLPTARVDLRDRSSDYLLMYTPTFMAAAVELGVSPQIFQNGLASIAWHDRFLRLSLSEAASYGQTNSAFLQPTTPGQSVTLQPAAGFSTIEFGSSLTSASAAWRTSRSITLLADASYFVSGGLTTDSQYVLPKQYGPRADFSVSNVLSRRDSVATVASAWDTNTTGACPGQAGATGPFCSEQAVVSMLEETLRHQFSPVTTLTLGAGVGVSLIETPSIGEEAFIAPVASATFSYRFGSGAGIFGGGGAGAMAIAAAPESASTHGEAREGETLGAGGETSPTSTAGAAAVTPTSAGTPSGSATTASEPPARPGGEAAGESGKGEATAAETAGSTNQPTPAGAAPGLSTGHLNELTLSAETAPMVDARTGLVSERLQTMAAFSRILSASTSVRATASLLQTVPIPTSEPYSVTSVNAGIEARVRLDRQLDVSFGVLQLWQEQAGYGNLTSTVGYVSLTAAAPTVRF